MGLDMYLEGRTYRWLDRRNPPMQEGFRVKGEIIELGYWRKHPNLHGYIVKEFANGEDDCKAIWLNEDHLQKIIAAIKNKQLPHTEGFFFGESDGTEDAEDIEILEKALCWLLVKVDGISKDVYYQASW